MTDPELAAHFFLQAGFILLACRAVGWIAARAGQPQVVAEMVAGFLIGPSFFGWIAPSLQTSLFPLESKRILFVVSQLALALYMFCVGLEFRLDYIAKHARRAAAVSIAGIVVPFMLGGMLGIILLDAGGFFTAPVRPVHAVLFVGAAMSITAFPVLARIIYERGIEGTALGTLALAAGAMDDAAAWIILAVAVGSFGGSPLLGALAAGGGILYVAVTFGLARPVFGRLSVAAEHHGGLAPWMLGATLAALAVGAWFTDTVGIHSVFGAFMLGAAIPRGLLTRQLHASIEPLTTALILPFFFVYSGLNTRLDLLDSAWLWTVALAVFLVACAGKGLACWLAAHLSGANRRDALGVGTLMNTRGMMELILLNIGLQRGLITPTLFTILVMMAIGTTLMTGPLFTYVYGRDPVEAPDRRLAVGKTS